MQRLLCNKVNDPEGSGQWYTDPAMSSCVISGKALLLGAEISRAMGTVPARWCNISQTNLYKDNLQNKSHHCLEKEQEDQKKVKLLDGLSKGCINEGQTP